LSHVPQLHYIPSKMIYAFSTGTHDNALIGITDGILRALNGPEITAVLAHEIDHMKNNNIKVINMADTITPVPHILYCIGQLLLLINPSLILTGLGPIPWLGVILLNSAPNVAALMWLGLSSTREYDAYLGAVDLTKDPRTLATAFQKLE